MDHKRVADAIISGEPATAETAMRALIQEALELMSVEEAKQARASRRRRSA
jgi:DNA-binding FadR family transcriptional regulator